MKTFRIQTLCAPVLVAGLAWPQGTTFSADCLNAKSGRSTWCRKG
jgi:hypothetical protein